MAPEKHPASMPSPPRVHPVIRWHRLIGIVSTLIVMVTIVTGLFINHSDAFNLSKKSIQTSLTQYLYGRPDIKVTGAYRSGTQWVTQIGQRVFLDRLEIFGHSTAMIGAIRTESALWVAFVDALVELDNDFNVVQRYGSLDGLELPIRAIGLSKGVPVVDSAGGLLGLDAALVEFIPIEDESDPEWQALGILPPSLERELLASYGGPQVTYERVLVDLHSGRLFGTIGVIIVDVAAICLLVLAVTGIYLYFKLKRGAAPPEQR